MKRQFNIIIERDSEGFYVGTVPELRGCHTQAKSLDILMKRVREAIDLCLEEEGARPVESSEFIGMQPGYSTKSCRTAS
jgi:predicted RNase H-like HicB family nuclease